MRKKMASLLIITGLALAGWNGYSWFSGTSSGREALGQDDIVQNTDNPLSGSENQKPITTSERGDSDGVATDSTQAEPLPVKIDTKIKKADVSPLRDYNEYAKGAEIGWLLIPELDMKYPIYWGTDDDTLNQGVGYHIGNFTTPPDGLRHTVLSGHRDTVFQELGELKAGSKMYVQFEDVQYEYQIEKTWITDAEDRTVIVEKDSPTLTLTTCYPFTFIGSAPDRYIIEAPLIAKTSMN
ncbi:class D sortase [Planomicrobium okeanokoites]|uniref:class D sortase n=1 Tax=Planomicrobium okeanokoites TaxID=244 RepID=UPI0009FECE1C|nr:class D sortase [Planomicrobium okeanokoites]